MITEIKKKILDGYAITREEAIQLVAHPDKESLYKAGDEIRLHFCGNVFEMCSITNAKSGLCSQDCKWCSQSSFHKTNIPIYNLIDIPQAREKALYNSNKGVNRMSLVTSGRKANHSHVNKLVEMFKDIHEYTNLKTCASLGLMETNQLKKLKDAGVDKYHCNLESSRNFFPTVVTSHTYDEKISTIKQAQAVGLDICSGGILGMGETMEDRLDMAFELRNLGVTSIPLNILSSVEGTVLQVKELPKEEELLTTFAIFRFINPKANIRFAAGRILIKNFQAKALRTGINSAIVGDLLTTIGTSVNEDKINFKNAGFKLIDNHGTEL